LITGSRGATDNQHSKNDQYVFASDAQKIHVIKIPFEKTNGYQKEFILFSIGEQAYRSIT
jgi:hypothetical protein